MNLNDKMDDNEDISEETRELLSADVAEDAEAEDEDYELEEEEEGDLEINESEEEAEEGELDALAREAEM